MSARFAAAHAAGADWRALVEDCARQLSGAVAKPTLGFVYATDAFAAEFDAIVAALRERTGLADWVGTVGYGVVAGDREYFDEPALAVMTTALPREAWRLMPPSSEWRVPALAGAGPGVAIVHGDGGEEALGERLADLAGASGAYVLGGLGSSRSELPQVAGSVGRAALSGVLLAPGLVNASGVSQGCSPIGAARTITAARDNLVESIDDMPALAALQADLAALPASEREAAARRLHVALPVPGSDTGDYLVRNIVGVDPRSGAIAVGDLVEPGRTLRFVRRDRDAAGQDLARMAAAARRRAGAAPAASLYFSCVARGPNLFGPGSAELALLRRELGDAPLIGLFCNGEIANARLYGYTGVLALFA